MAVRSPVDGETPDQINLPQGCRFMPRYPYAKPICATCDHSMFEAGDRHFHACLLAGTEQEA